MIKKRTRPTLRVRDTSPEDRVEEDKDQDQEEGTEKLSVAELIELRKLKKSREGIDAAKLGKGDGKRKKKRTQSEAEKGGLRPGVKGDESEEDEAEKLAAKARRAVRQNNFTQQTNALDVDKHMMAYIEENLKIRSRPQELEEDEPADPQDELYRLAEKWKVEKKAAEEGSVTNSLAMLTAIPEVDLGMDTRLRNIEDTEKAKREAADQRKDRLKINKDEEHLVANRFYRPNLRQKSDADIMREAKREAMGLPPQDESHSHNKHDRTQTATDEITMERFKKRMRK